MKLIILQREIFKTELKDVFHIGIDLHLRKREGFPRQLQFSLLKMVIVKMDISKAMNEVTRCEATNLCNQY